MTSPTLKNVVDCRLLSNKVHEFLCFVSKPFSLIPSIIGAPISTADFNTNPDKIMLASTGGGVGGVVSSPSFLDARE
jgi:hypothetical protein